MICSSVNRFFTSNLLLHGIGLQSQLLLNSGGMSPVSGNLSSNTLETILSAVRAGLGIGMFNSASLVGELRHPDIMTILDSFIDESRDISLVWPRRRFIPARLKAVTAFLADQLAVHTH